MAEKGKKKMKMKKAHKETVDRDVEKTREEEEVVNK